MLFNKEHVVIVLFIFIGNLKCCCQGESGRECESVWRGGNVCPVSRAPYVCSFCFVTSPARRGAALAR